jgi:DNA-binding CsgD family transcriptional regulator
MPQSITSHDLPDKSGYASDLTIFLAALGFASIVAGICGMTGIAAAPSLGAAPGGLPWGAAAAALPQGASSALPHGAAPYWGASSAAAALPQGASSAAATALPQGAAAAALPQGAAATLPQGLGLLLMLLGMAAIQFISYTPLVERPQAERFGGRTLAVSLAFAAALFALGAGPLISPGAPGWIYGLAWLALGALCGLLLPLWGHVWTALDAQQAHNRATARTVAWAFAAAALLGLPSLFAPMLARAAFTLALFLCSNFLLVYCTKRIPRHEPMTVKASKARLSIFSRNLLLPLLMTALLGACLCFAHVRLDAQLFFPLLLGALLLAALIMAGVLTLLPTAPKHSSLERCIVPLAALGLVALVAGPGAVRFAALCLLLLDAGFFLIAHFNCLVALSYRHKVLTFYHYMQGFIAPFGGLALGWAAMSLGLAYADEAVFLQGLSLTFLLLLVAVVSIAPFSTNTQVETLFDDSAAEEEDRQGSWQRRCMAICEEHRLSPREVEVFLLLAKGRNADHIGRALFISSHTAKTHIWRIYRKLLVNSQQELIDAVDARRDALP